MTRNIGAIAVAGILFVWLAVRFGAAVKILFVRWRDQLAEKRRIREQRCSICFNTDTITVVDLREKNGAPFKLRWSEINRLTVFKRDLFTVDLLCLLFEFSGDRAIEFDEDMEGWKALIDGLPHHLQGCKAQGEWFPSVAFPAFAPNPTEIYRREATQTE